MGNCLNLLKKSFNLEVGIAYHGLGPLHTWAKSDDHEIVRAQKKVSKGYPKDTSKICSVVTCPQNQTSFLFDWIILFCHIVHVMLPPLLHACHLPLDSPIIPIFLHL